jgi:hypothetical protein
VQVLSTRYDPASIPPPASVLRPAAPDQTAVLYVIAPVDPLFGDPTELAATYFERTGQR